MFKNKPNSVNQLYRLHLSSAVASLLLAVAAALLMRDSPQQLRIGHLTRDELASKTSAAFAPATHFLFDIGLRSLLILLLVLSSAFSAYYLQKRFKDKYERGLSDRVVPFRWLKEAITGALMLEIVALISGINDVLVLKLMGGLIVISCVLFWLSERENRKAKKPALAQYWLAVASAALPWLLILGVVLLTPIYGMVRQPWYAYALYAVVAAGSVAKALNFWRHLRRQGKWDDYKFTERNYILISAATKVIFAIILIAGFHR